MQMIQRTCIVAPHTLSSSRQQTGTSLEFVANRVCSFAFSRLMVLARSTCSFGMDDTSIMSRVLMSLLLFTANNKQVMASKMTLGGDVDFQQIAKKTPGFVGADLSSLTKEAAVVAINRIFTRLRAVTPSPAASSVGLSAMVACGSSTGLPRATPNEALGKGIGGDAADGANVAEVVTKGLSPPAAAVSEGGGESADKDEVMNDSGGSPVNKGDSLSPSPSLGVQEEKGNTGIVGAGEKEEAKAVGGFLAGPLSAAQLAPLSVTMEDFLMAVKKVNYSCSACFHFFHPLQWPACVLCRCQSGCAVRSAQPLSTL